MLGAPIGRSEYALAQLNAKIQRATIVVSTDSSSSLLAISLVVTPFLRLPQGPHRWHDGLVEGIQVDPAACFHAVRDCQRELGNVAFVHLPFEELLRGRPLAEEDDEPMHPKQKQAVSCVEEDFLNESVWPSLSDPERALWHSGRGPLSSSPFTALPTFAVTRFDPQPCHASHFPLLPMRPSTRHFWPSGGPWQTRVGSGIGCRTSLPKRGGRVSTNVMLRDLDVAQKWMAEDWRLLWMVCPTSPAPNSQLTPPWCPLSTGTDEQDEEQRPLQGSHCAEPPRRKKQKFSRAARSQVVGRWSNEAAQFLGQLAAFKVSTAPEILRERVRGAWLRRWRNILSCSGSRGFRFVLVGQATCDGCWQLSAIRPRGCEGLQARVV